MELQSPAFEQGQPIPRKYCRKGDNLSPPLRWSDAPEDAKSFVLVVEDPDAPSGTFRHWGVYGIEPDRKELAEGAAGDRLQEVVNDFGDRGYDGPQPPRGTGTHHYHFRIAALDIERLEVPANAKVADLWRAAKPHVIDEAELIGTFEQR
jgi:hypothetical protein